MICFHSYRYSGPKPFYRWLAGVAGGVKIDVTLDTKTCIKCGKVKIVNAIN